MGKSVLPSAQINSIPIKATSWSLSKDHPWRLCRVSSDIRIIQDYLENLTTSLSFSYIDIITDIIIYNNRFENRNFSIFYGAKLNN